MFTDQRNFFRIAGRINDGRVIHIAIEGRIRTTYRIDNDEVEILRFQFFEAILDVIFGLGGKTDQNLAVLLAAELFQNVGGRLEF